MFSEGRSPSNMSKMSRMRTVVSMTALFGFIGGVTTLSVSLPQSMVNLTNGQTANLSCTFVTSQPTNNLNIQWSMVSKSSMAMQQIYYYQSGEYRIGDKFKGRVTVPVSPNTTFNASISISNMKPEDSGLYYCEVNNFPDIEGKNQGKMLVNVFEAPSAPYCGIHGTVESGHFITLTCHTERGNPPPTYTWSRLGSSQRQSPRAATNIQTGVLQIRNLSQFEFGVYQCNASNILGSKICTINLTEEAVDGVIAGAVIGAILGACLLIFFVWFIVHKLRKNKYRAAKAASGTEMKTSPTSTGEAGYKSVPSQEAAAEQVA